LVRHARSLCKRVDGLANAAVRGPVGAPSEGNVRARENAPARAAIPADGPTLPPAARSSPPLAYAPPAPPPPPPPRRTLRTVARRDQLAKPSLCPRPPRPATSRPVVAKGKAVDPYARPDALEERRKVVAAVALVLVLWGIILVLGGMILRARIDPSKASPLGN